MKKDIHPKLNKVVFVDVMSDTEFVATSTLSSEETKKINGEDHFVIKVETSSASHPFYTGKRRNETKNDQVAKFLERVAKAQEKNKPKTAETKKEVSEEKDEPKKKTTAKKAPAKKTTKKK